MKNKSLIIFMIVLSIISILSVILAQNDSQKFKTQSYETDCEILETKDLSETEVAKIKDILKEKIALDMLMQQLAK